MKVVFIRTPGILGPIGSHSRQHPINLAYLAAVARRMGWTAQIFDFEVEKTGEKVFKRRLREAAPDAVGFTAMTPLVHQAGEMAMWVREAAPRAKILVGGAHPSAAPEETLRRFSGFDLAVAGEGERALESVLTALGEGRDPAALAGTVGGLYARTEGGGAVGRRQTAGELLNMDDLPFPARDLLPLSLYGGATTPGIPNIGRRATQLFTSRGCFAWCIFCSSEKTFTRKVRARSAENVAAELEECVARWGFRHFTVDDDVFTFNRKRVEAICDAFRRLKVTWDCDCRVDMVDGPLLKRMADSGCLKIAFGVESGSQRVLDLIAKNISVEKIERAFRLAREAGLMTCAFLMVGNHPDEREEDVRETERLTERLQPDLIDVTIATPLPNTELYRLLSEEGLIEGEDWSRFKFFFGSPPWRTRHFSSRDLVRLQRRVLRSFYLRPGYLLRRVSRIRTMADARYWASAGAGFLRVLFDRRAA